MVNWAGSNGDFALGVEGRDPLPVPGVGRDDGPDSGEVNVPEIGRVIVPRAGRVRTVAVGVATSVVLLSVDGSQSRKNASRHSINIISIWIRHVASDSGSYRAEWSFLRFLTVRRY